MKDEHSRVARRLLAAGASEAPSAAARARTMAAVTAAGTGAVGAAVATKPHLLMMLAKWLCIGAAGGAVVSGGLVAVDTVMESAPTHTAVMAPTASGSSLAMPAAPPSSSTLQIEPTIADSGPDSKSIFRPPLPSASTTLSAGPERLRLELSRLRSARQTIRSGQARQGLALLSSYRAEFPRRQLEDEATVLEVEAWLALGDRRRAQAVGNSYLRRRPDSAHRGRIKRLLESP